MADPGNGKSAVTDPPDDRPEFPPRARTLTARTLTLEDPRRVDSAGLNISVPNGRSRRNLSAARRTSEGRQSTQTSRSRRVLRTAGVEHEDQFPPPRVSGRCGFSRETFAGTRGNGRDAP